MRRRWSIILLPVLGGFMLACSAVSARAMTSLQAAAGLPSTTSLQAADQAGISAPLLSRRVPTGARLVDCWEWGGGADRVRPIALDIHPSGVVAGIEVRQHRLFLVSADGSWIGFGEQGRTDLGFATRVFARSGLQLFTLDPQERAVDRFNLRGIWEYRLDLEEIASDAGEELGEIVDLCLDRTGDLFLLDAGKAQILRIGRTGDLQQVLGKWGDWTMQVPVALDVDGQGKLYVLETRPPGLLILDYDGHMLGWRAATAGGDESLQPTALAVDAWGNAFLADAHTGALKVLPAASGAAWWIQPPGGEKIRASDLVVDKAERLLVADADAARVWVFALDYNTEVPADVPGSGP